MHQRGVQRRKEGQIARHFVFRFALSAFLFPLFFSFLLHLQPDPSLLPCVRPFHSRTLKPQEGATELFSFPPASPFDRNPILLCFLNFPQSFQLIHNTSSAIPLTQPTTRFPPKRPPNLAHHGHDRTRRLLLRDTARRAQPPYAAYSQRD